MTQPFEDDPDLRAIATDVQWDKYMEVVEGWQVTAELLKRHKVKMGFGTDLVFTPQNNGQQGDMLARFSPWFSNVEMLRMITSTNGELIALGGQRNLYQDGPLGMIEEGAYADIILVDGNPLEDITLLGDDGNHIPLVMKDGIGVKDKLDD